MAFVWSTRKEDRTSRDANAPIVTILNIHLVYVRNITMNAGMENVMSMACMMAIALIMLR